MRRQLAFAFLLTVLLPSTSAAAGPRALVAVENPPSGAVAQLLDDHVMVVRDLGSYLLVAADAKDASALARHALVWRVLDADIAGRAYYTVGYRDASALGRIDGLRILRDDGHEAVIECTSERAEAIVATGLDVARVFIRPIRAPRAAPAAPRLRTTSWDADVQAIVDAVQGTRIDADVQRLQTFVTRYATTDSCLAAANWIRSQFQSFGIDSVVFHNWSGTYKPNVVAVIPGRGDPSKQVLIGGHYDSYTSAINNCPGADDDASGTACVLECAKVLAGHPFNYTLVFVTFCAEEEGLYGSEAYAAAAQARGDDIVAMIGVDMIGYLAAGDVLDLDIIDNSASAWLSALATEMGPLYVPALPLVDGTLPSGASSDHASFWAHGYDAILFFEDTGNYSPYIHTANDLVGLSYNSPALALRSVKAAAALLATVAEPFHVTIAHTPLSNTTDTTNPYPVTARIVSAEALAPDSLVVHWSTPFASGTATFAPTGNPDEYVASIPAQPGGVTVRYWLAAQDVSGHRATDPKNAPTDTHSFFVGAITTFWTDDFEAARGWTVGAAGDNATTGIWVRSDPVGTYNGSALVQPEDDHTPAPGVMCFVTGNTPPGGGQGDNDVDGGVTTLLSPVFDLSTRTNATVRYYRWYTNDTGASPETDIWAVDVSANGGTTWTRIETLGSSDRTWRLVERDLEAYVPLTSQIRFRFVARDDEPGSIVEAAIDDFSLVTYQEPATSAPVVAQAERLSLAQSFPNPGRAGATISFTVPSPGRAVTLRIYDLAGRRVASLIEGERVIGARAVAWNGRDDAGREVAAGVYFYRLRAGSETLSRRLVMIR